MKTRVCAIALSIVSASAVAKVDYQAPFIETATGQVIEGSAAELDEHGFKAEIPNVPFGRYRVCIPVGEGGIDLGLAEVDEHGALKREGPLPAGEYPLQLTVHPNAGACSSPALYYSDPDEDEQEKDD